MSLLIIISGHAGIPDVIANYLHFHRTGDRHVERESPRHHPAGPNRKFFRTSHNDIFHLRELDIYYCHCVVNIS